MKQIEKQDLTAENLIEIIRDTLLEEGYETKRFSDGNKFYTTDYDCVMVRISDDLYYELSIKKTNILPVKLCGKSAIPKYKYEMMDKQYEQIELGLQVEDLL